MNIGKIAIVIFLTALIWVWADLAQDEGLPVANVQVTIAKSSDPSLWVSFRTDSGALRSSATINTVELKGPAARVAEVVRMRNKGALNLELFLVPETEGMTTPDAPPFDVLGFLRRSDSIRKLGLTVESCEPRTFRMQVVRLQEALIPVECIDTSGITLKPQQIEPSQVKAYVPPDGTFTAKLQLAPGEIEQARRAVVLKSPFVELAPGQTRSLATNVQVRMPATPDTLEDHTITTATLGYCMSEVLQGKYRVEVSNLPDMATVLVRATPAARQAYERQPFQMILHILDDDRRAGGELRRPVTFNFPDESVRRGEITPAQQPPEARFKLVPVPTSAEESGM